MSKFNIGDKVRVIEYGSLMWRHKEEHNKWESSLGKSSFKLYKEVGDILWLDTMPEIVGKKGVIDNISNIQGDDKYSIKGIMGKTAWYNENQLELVDGKED